MAILNAPLSDGSMAIRSFPPASECDRETLLDIAALAAHGQSWELLGSSAHVEAICRLLVERVEPELRAANATAAATMDRSVNSSCRYNSAVKVSGLMKRWQCSRKSVLDAIKTGRLRAFQIGTSHWRISLDEVVRYESNRRAAQEGEAS